MTALHFYNGYKLYGANIFKYLKLNVSYQKSLIRKKYGSYEGNEVAGFVVFSQ